MTARVSASPGQVAKALGSAMVGNWFELFDFIIYGYFAAQIGKAMFPSADVLVSILSSFATYGVGFVMRPVGSIVLGSLGDRLGRKRSLVITLFLMAVSTCGTGLIPTYAQIGVAAPALLVACRLLQGFAAGGEWGGATTFLVEYAPPHRRGLFGALQQLSTSLAVVTAVGVALAINAWLPAASVQNFGWRIPFIVGIVVAPVGFYLRSHVADTPGYAAEAKADTVPQHPLREALGHHFPAIATIFGCVIVWTVAGYTYGAFLVNFATRVLKIDPTWAYGGTLLGALVNILVIPLAGYLSDRVGRKPFLLVSSAGFLITAWPLFSMLDHARTGPAMLVCTAVAGVFSGLFSGTGPTFLCEQLPTRVRYTALSIGYNFAVMLFGGFAPFISTWLVKQTGLNIAPAFYIMAAAMVSFLTILSTRDRFRDETL